jgi:hypothetical protein
VSELAGRVEELRRSARAERLRARAPRYAFLALATILCLVGLKTIVSPPAPAISSDATAGLVDQAAEDFALRFTRAYLTYDAARPELRERALRPFLPEELDVDAGMVPSRGSEDVEWLQVAQHQEALAGGVVIVVAAQLGGEPEPTYLAVPIERRPSGDLQLINYPSIVGPPAITTAALPSYEEVDDKEVVTVVQRVVTNYLAGEEADLRADLAPEATYSLPAQQLSVQSVDDVTWATTPENPAVLVTVEATDSDRSIWTLTYEVGIDQSGGRTTATYVETVPNAT